MKLKNKIFSSLAVLTVLFAVGSHSAIAEESTISRVPQITTNQGFNANNGSGQSGGANRTQTQNGSNIAANITADIDQKSDEQGRNLANQAVQAGKNLGQSSLNTANNVASEQAANIANSVTTQADGLAGSGTNRSGLFDGGIFQRVDNVVTDLGSNWISLLLKVSYYTFFGSMIFGFIMFGLSFFFKSIKGTKWFWSAVISGILYGVMSQVLGLGLFSPITDLWNYIFYGR